MRAPLIISLPLELAIGVQFAEVFVICFHEEVKEMLKTSKLLALEIKIYILSVFVLRFHAMPGK